jgi:hypothetical protein
MAQSLNRSRRISVSSWKKNTPNIWKSKTSGSSQEIKPFQKIIYTTVDTLATIMERAPFFSYWPYYFRSFSNPVSLDSSELKFKNCIVDFEEKNDIINHHEDY